MAAPGRGATPEHPHRGLHRVVFAAAALCLVVQVVEGALFAPFVLVYLGFPQVGLREICRELYNITYQDDDRECRHPYPLFFRDFTPEPARQESKEDVFGPVTPPRPRYRVPGWREMVSIVEARRAAEANPTGAALAYHDLLERAAAVQRKADRHLIIGSVLIGTMILGLFGLPFFLYGLWLLYRGEREGLPVRPALMTFVGYLVLVDGAMNTLGGMIDALANHSLLVRTFIMGTGLVFDAGYFWQYNTLLVGGTSAPGEKAWEVANGVVLFPMRIVAAYGFLTMKRWGLQWMVVTCWMGVYAWVGYMWNLTTYSEMRMVDVLAPVWGWWLYNIWYVTPFIAIPFLYTINREMFTDE